MITLLPKERQSNNSETAVGREKFSSTLQDSSSWSKIQTDIRQINKRKKSKFNHVHRKTNTDIKTQRNDKSWQRDNKSERNWPDKSLCSGASINKEFYTDFGLGCKVVKNNRGYTAFSVLNSLSLMIKMSLCLLVQGGYIWHGRFISCFLDTKEDQTVLAWPVSKELLIQKRQYAKRSHLRADYSWPL